MAGETKSRDGSARDSLKRGAEATANGIHQVTNFVAMNDDRVADGAQPATHLVGLGLDKAGQRISATGKQASKVLHGNASRAADAVRDAISGSEKSGALPVGRHLTFANSKLAMFVTFPYV